MHQGAEHAFGAKGGAGLEPYFDCSFFWRAGNPLARFGLGFVVILVVSFRDGGKNSLLRSKGWVTAAAQHDALPPNQKG